MKTQPNLIKPPTFDLAIRKYLIKTDAPVSYPKGTHAVGHYQLDTQYIMVYKEAGELVFDLGCINHRKVTDTLHNTLIDLERYLTKTKFITYNDSIVLKYTRYWG